jgi:hypothetical protein
MPHLQRNSEKLTLSIIAGFCGAMFEINLALDTFPLLELKLQIFQ